MTEKQKTNQETKIQSQSATKKTRKAKTKEETQSKVKEIDTSSKSNVKENIKDNNHKRSKTKILEKTDNPIKKIGKEQYNLLEVILIMIITVVFGVFIGSTINHQKPTQLTAKISELEKVYNNILENYYADLNEDELLEAAVKGMMNYLGDGYSVYMDNEEANEFEEQLDGTYYGMGAELTYDGQKTYVSKVFEDSPAQKSGLRVNDTIIAVNGENVEGKLPADISDKIKGNDNMTVEIKVLRENVEYALNLQTAKVDIPSVTTKIFEKNNQKIGYIYATIFAANTQQQFKKALNDMNNEKIDALIIDVRDNLGGHLSTVTDMLEMLLPKNTPLYQIKTKDKIEKTVDSTQEHCQYPIAVLINGVSASASEILASALKEEANAILVGEKTYGKGTVQRTMELSTGGLVKYTIQTWLTAQGNEINKVGVSPTIEVKLNDDYYETRTDEKDNQLQEAIKALTEK